MRRWLMVLVAVALMALVSVPCQADGGDLEVKVTEIGKVIGNGWGTFVPSFLPTSPNDYGVRVQYYSELIGFDHKEEWVTKPVYRGSDVQGFWVSLEGIDENHFVDYIDLSIGAYGLPPNPPAMLYFLVIDSYGWVIGSGEGELAEFLSDDECRGQIGEMRRMFLHLNLLKSVPLPTTIGLVPGYGSRNLGMNIVTPQGARDQKMCYNNRYNQSVPGGYGVWWR